MSKVTVRRRGPVGNAGRVTLQHLRTGETFRFPRSAPGTVYQLLAPSERMLNEVGVFENGVDGFMFAELSTGQIHVAEESRTVVPINCSVTLRERVNVEPVTKKKTARSTKTVRATKRRSTR